MAIYRISEDAKADLRRIYRRGIREYGEALADQYYDAFFDRFEELAEQPYLYQAVDEIREGYRRSVCGVDSIYYRVDGDTVEIMAILGQQDVDEWI
jgi:toxin ParE1/3/4